MSWMYHRILWKNKNATPFSRGLALANEVIGINVSMSVDLQLKPRWRILKPGKYLTLVSGAEPTRRCLSLGEG